MIRLNGTGRRPAPAWGFLQLTGYANYNDYVQQPWDNIYGIGNKDFMCRSTSCDANLNAIADNLEFSMKIAMASFQNASKQVDKNTLKIINNDNIDKISTKINGGLIGKESRRKYSKNAYDEFNK